MACASGVWRAISSSVISSDMPSCWGKEGVWPDRFPKNLTRAVADYGVPEAAKGIVRDRFACLVTLAKGSPGWQHVIAERRERLRSGR